MVKGLEYRFIEPVDKRRRASFEVEMPMELFEEASSQSRVCYELGLPRAETVIDRHVGIDERLTLGFLYSGMVGDWYRRLDRVLGVIGEVDTLAATMGMSDPRVQITDPLSEYKAGNFGFSFERPTGSEVAAVERIRIGMIKAATFLQGHISKEAAERSVSVSQDSEGGYVLRTHGERIESILLSQSADGEGRARVVSERDSWYAPGSAQGFAVSLAGVIAALDPPHPPRD